MGHCNHYLNLTLLTPISDFLITISVDAYNENKENINQGIISWSNT